LTETQLRWRSVGVFCVGLVALLALHRARPGTTSIGLGLYGTVVVTYLLVKLLAAGAYRPMDRNVPRLSVAVVIPFFNEDPTLFERCLRSVLAQDKSPDEVYVIDDGSANRDCYFVAERLATEFPVLRVRRSPENRGKRHAQEAAFRSTDCDVIVTMDSDTTLDADALSNGLQPFRRHRTKAVCGNVRVLNHTENWLSRLIAVRYSNAFEYERAAYSVFDSLLCATGVFTLWRTEVIKGNLDDYVTQTFLGVPVTYGDDRRLTNYALMMGTVVFQSTAIARTLAPTKLRHFVRQQIRWNKSFFRETLYAPPLSETPRV